MILGAEIALLIMGIVALVRGKLTLTKTKVVYGLPARLLAIVCVMPLPLALFVGFCVGVYAALMNPHFDFDEFQRHYQVTFIAIEFGILILCIGLLYGIGVRFAIDPNSIDEVEELDEDHHMDGDDRDFEERERRHRDGQPLPPPLPTSAASTFPCTGCDATLKISSAIAGKKVRCPKCQTVLLAPPLAASSDQITTRPQGPSRT